MTPVELYYKGLVRPTVFWLTRKNAEIAHEWGLRALEVVQNHPRVGRLVERACLFEDPVLSQEILGTYFGHPLGLGAGWDKYLRVYWGGLPRLGWSFAELGGITAHAQSGNPGVRVLRSSRHEAIWNFMGLNNGGADKAALILKEHPFPMPPMRIGINLNKTTATPIEKAAEDFVYSLVRVWHYANFFTINVSCPNTGDFNDLRRRDLLAEILAALQATNAALGRGMGGPKPIGVKISPDLTDNQLADIIAVCRQYNVAFIVAVNTTTSRVGCHGWNIPAHGGVSGKLLHDTALRFTRDLYQAVGCGMKIIGVGGIYDGATLYERICNGASLCEAYTAWIFEGPDFVKRCLRDVVDRLRSDGFPHISHAVGSAL